MYILKGGIGFFDSGIGGLTVMNTCRKYLPNERFYYYGDNIHAPYGNLPTEKIKTYVFNAFERFQRLNVKVAVVACNTATAVCVEELRKRYAFPIIGTEPAVLSAARAGGEVLILVTRATYQSERFQELCARAQTLYPNAVLCPTACDCLAGVIEKNVANPNFDYTAYLPKGNPTSVVLGCTHYIYIEEVIRRFYGCKIYDGNEGIARRLCSVLGKEIHLEGENSLKTQKEWDFQPQTAEKWDWRPQTTHFEEKKDFVEGETPLKQKANKCSHSSGQRNLKMSKKVEKPRIFYLGSSPKKNEKTYKQTFGRGESG